MMWTNPTKDRTRPDEAAREFQEMSMTGEYGSMSELGAIEIATNRTMTTHKEGCSRQI